MSKKEMKYKYWIYCLIPTFVVFLILYYFHPDECPENARYILSAISQGLAAILALVFTITLVVAQMTRRYTAMDKIIFRLETKLLMFLFGIGIIAPLLVIYFGFWGWGVILSFVIASFCIFSLLPFLIGINNVLKYDIGIVNLNEEIMQAIRSENEAKAVQGIRDLESICKDAIKESREDITLNIIHILSEIGKKNIEMELERATLNVITGLNQIGLDAIDHGFGDVTLLFLTEALGDLRIGSAKNKWKPEALLATYKLKEIGCKAAEKKLEIATIKAIDGLKYFDLVDAGIGSNNEAAQGLWYFGVFTTEYLPYEVDYVIQTLNKFDRSIFAHTIINWERSFIEKYPNLKTSLDKFKTQYSGQQ